MDVCLLIITLLVLWDAKVKNNMATQFSREEITILKGIGCLLVLTHHIAQRSTGGYLFSIMGYIGFYIVGLFYFISGYGIMRSFQMQGNMYLKNFLVRRVGRVVGPYTIACVLYYLLRTCMGNPIEVASVLAAFFLGRIIPFSWYIISICVCYLLFWGLASGTGENGKMMSFGMLILILLYTAVCIKIGFGGSWYSSVLMFVFGVAYQAIPNIRNTVYRMSNMYWIAVLGVGAILLGILSRLVESEWYVFLICNVAVGCFCILILAIFLRFSVGNVVLLFLGKHSFEIYLYQGVFVELIKIGSGFGYVLYATVMTFILAVGMKKINAKVFGSGG